MLGAEGNWAPPWTSRDSPYQPCAALDLRQHYPGGNGDSNWERTLCGVRPLRTSGLYGGRLPSAETAVHGLTT